MSSKSLQTTFLFYFNAKSTPKVLLTFNNKVEKTNHKNLILFIFFLLLLSFFFFRRHHNSKSIRSLQILNIPNDCSANLLYSYLFWAPCELRVVSYGLKLSLSHFAVSCVRFCFSRNNFFNLKFFLNFLFKFFYFLILLILFFFIIFYFYYYFIFNTIINI